MKTLSPFSSASSAKPRLRHSFLIPHSGFVICLLLFFATAAQAQWQSESYDLKGGWNSIYLHGDATHASPDELFASNPEVVEVWRWNSNPSQLQFTTSPMLPAPGTPEWNMWVRGGTANTLTQMSGQAGYLVKCNGTSANAYSVTIPQRPLPPSAVWVRNGANFLGFPSFKNGANYPSFSQFFATFPAAIAANTKIFKYVGGDLGPANPIQVFSPTAEKLDRNEAYWFSAEVVGDFYAPLDVSLSNSKGIDFGRSGSDIVARLYNRTAAVVTITLTGSSSAAVPVVPAGLPAVEGDVPLTRRILDPATGIWTETPVSAQNTLQIGPQSSVEVHFGIDRSQMTGSNGAVYASLLKITDSSNLVDMVLPVRASVGALAGLWIGEASVTNVVSKVATSPGSTTARPYPLRMLIHVDDDGTARLLSQVFLGTLDAVGDPQGVCIKEIQLKQDLKASALRFSVAHMPLDRVIEDLGTGNSGNMSLGGTMVRTLSVDYREGTNPFVHLYHPDHDNKDARPDGSSIPKGNGEESYTITRQFTFQFASTAPAGSNATGWGTQTIGGNYSEVLSGVHKEDIQLSGTFELRRVSEIGSITTTTVVNP